jgi:hypothetical protein
VNIEEAMPKQTDEFVRRSGASLVVDDVTGSLLKQLGGAGLPLLVIVDGTGTQVGAAPFEVVYRHEGFEGTRRLREIIDGVGKGDGTLATAEPRPAPPSLRDEAAQGRPVVHSVEAEPEFSWASDIFLTDSRLQYGQERGGTEWTAGLTYASYDMDYRPNPEFDFFGFDEHLREDLVGGDANLRQRLADRFTLLASGGFYQGYPNYRRVWIANRYRQKYANPNFSTIPGYEEPDPKGWNGSGGVRWEYLPATGYAELKLGYAYEQTAPGYEDGNDPQGNYVLIRGREQLDTAALNFSSENVLSPRVRALQEFSFTQTTARDLRFSYQGSINLALGERWVVHGNGGVATEAPRFDAYYFGATLEHEIIPSLLLSVTGRYYKDTGEIENSLLTSSAAPPLESWEVGLGLRYAWRHAALKIYFAPFWTHYATPGVGSAEFLHLYEDRRWWLAQFAFSGQF